MNNLFFRNIDTNKENFLEKYNLPNNKKSNLQNIKNNTCKSLYEVGYFLTNFQKFINCIKLHKILK